MTDRISHQRLLEVVTYDPLTGRFAHLERSRAISLKPNAHGYLRLMVDGRRYPQHILAWFYVTGRWPEDEIDHINTDRADNRWENLREATHLQNAQNRRLHINSSSGLKGAQILCKGKWQSIITINGQYTYLGVFSTPEEAHAAYAAKAKEAFGEYARVA